MTSGSAFTGSAESRRPLFALERVIGASHVRSGKPCQDEVGVWAVSDTVAIAVADGHGSSKHAEVGARLAVQAALEALARFAESVDERSSNLEGIQSYASHPLRVQLVREWTARVRNRAGTEDVALLDYGTTILFALATPRFLLLGQLGDGDMLLVEEDGGVRSPLPPDPRAFADETPSLCLPEAWQSLRVLALPAPPGECLLLVSTDGYSKSYSTDAIFRQIGPDYLELIRSDGLHGLQPHLHGFLEQVTTQGSGDDIALALLYWPAATASEETAPEVSDPEHDEPEANVETKEPAHTDAVVEATTKLQAHDEAVKSTDETKPLLTETGDAREADQQATPDAGVDQPGAIDEGGSADERAAEDH